MFNVLIERMLLRFLMPGWFSAFLLFLFSQNLFSQNSDTTLLSPVVIQATRVPARNPVPHTNLTAAAIAQIYHAQDIPYLLSNVPSLVESSDGGTGIGYTGMRIRGSDPTRINVSINGIPLNDAESQGVYWVNLPDLAASAAEIQVQRGVGTSTNGAGAFGATVNIDLSRVYEAPFATLSNTLGSFGTQKHSLYAGTGPLKGGFSWTARLSSIKSNGYIDRASADLNSLHLNGNWIRDRQSLQVHFLSGQETTYQAWNGVPAQYVDDPVRRTYNTAGTERPGAPYKNEVDRYTQKHGLAHYKLLLNKQLALQLNGHYTRGYGYYEQYKAAQRLSEYSGNSADSSSSDLIRRLWLDNYFYGSTFVLRWSPKYRYHVGEMSVGGGLHRYEGRHYGQVIWAQKSDLPKDFNYYDNNADKTDANLFWKTEARFGENWYLTLDLQYRTVQYHFLGFDNLLRNVAQTANLHFFNPKIGLSRSKNANTWYFFSGIGNREPNRDDYTQSTPENRPRPERLYDFEAGWKARHPRWNMQINGFGMLYKDQLVLDGRINNVGAYIRTNVTQSERLGVEWEGDFKLLERVQVSAQVAWSKNTVREFQAYVDNWDDGSQQVFTYSNTPLAFSPALIAGTEINWDVLPKSAPLDLRLSWSGKHIGKQYLDNTGNEQAILKAYTFRNVRLNAALKRREKQPIRLICSIQNLFNAKYSANGWTYRYISGNYDARPDNPYTRKEQGSVYNQTGYFPQAGRSWMLTLVLAM